MYIRFTGTCTHTLIMKKDIKKPIFSKGWTWKYVNMVGIFFFVFLIYSSVPRKCIFLCNGSLVFLTLEFKRILYCMCMFVGTCVSVWRAEDSLHELFLSSTTWAPGTEFRSLSLVVTFPLSHLTGPHTGICAYSVLG